MKIHSEHWGFFAGIVFWAALIGGAAWFHLLMLDHQAEESFEDGFRAGRRQALAQYAIVEGISPEGRRDLINAGVDLEDLDSLIMEDAETAAREELEGVSAVVARQRKHELLEAVERLERMTDPFADITPDQIQEILRDADLVGVGR